MKERINKIKVQQSLGLRMIVTFSFHAFRHAAATLLGLARAERKKGFLVKNGNLQFAAKKGNNVDILFNLVRNDFLLRK